VSNADRSASVPIERNAGGGADASLAGRTILAVFAHPDDESLACGGTLARAADAGAHVIVFCASRGERGSISDAALVPDGDLGSARARELREAAAVLGVAEVMICSHPDGELRWTEASELQRDIAAAIGRWRPDAVVTFDKDGLYWHGDHIGVHERTVAAIRSIGAAAPPLYYVTIPQGAMRELVAAAGTKAGAPASATLWGIAADAFGYEAEAPTFVVDVRNWVGRKLAALKCHRTQIGPQHPLAWIDEPDARRWLGIEQFRRAPEDTTGHDVLEPLGAR
jgi:LmbE family N-acetylglucosaminyl deacetylase